MLKSNLAEFSLLKTLISILQKSRVRDYSGTPLLWRCGAKATTKSGSGKPGPKGHAQKDGIRISEKLSKI